MEHLIRFRMLASQLDDAEFNDFVLKIIKSHGGRELLLNCVFEHFALQIDCVFEHFKSRHQTLRAIEPQIAPLTETISEIITERELGAEEQAAPAVDNVSALPSALISELASYLKAAEYIVLSRCSRKIYVSCNSPCKIYHIPTCMLKKYPHKSSMAKFKSLRCLGLNIPFFNLKVSRRNQNTWRGVQLHTLQLSNRGGNENDLDCFLRNGAIRNTTNLKLHKFGHDVAGTYDSAAFCSLLATFGMIENLLLWDVWLSDGVAFSTDDVRKWLPNLKGFGFTGGHNQALSQCIIRALAPQLEALRIEGLEYDQIKDLKFPKLQELSLSMCGTLRILEVFKAEDSLNSVMISSSQKPIIERFINIMVSKENMRHIHIKSPAKLLKFAMERTECELFETLHLERPQKALQVILDGNNWGEGGNLMMNQLHHGLFRLINALEKSRMDDFILRVKITSKKDIKTVCPDIKDWLGVLRGWERSHLVHHEFSCKKDTFFFIFTISNLGCRVNGYRYSWKMWSSSL